MTMRVLKNRAGRIIEAQSGAGDLDVLVQNALAAGMRRGDVSAVVMTDEQYKAELAAQIQAEKPYDQLRREEYPPIDEQLDAMWEGGEAAEKMRERIAAVKAKYPKPD